MLHIMFLGIISGSQIPLQEEVFTAMQGNKELTERKKEDTIIRRKNKGGSYAKQQ